MKHYKHLFFDMDKTIAPARQPMLPEMYALLSSLPHTITIVSGSTLEQIALQSHKLPAYTLGQNGNHATDEVDELLWHFPLDESHRKEILEHIALVTAALDHDLHHEWQPIEDRGGQITFSPLGNTAPVALKMAYDPDASKRKALMKKVPFVSKDLVVKIGGSTSFDYIHKDRHKGTAVQRLIDHKGWNKDESLYFGDGLYPGGNDEAVIGVIDTILVKDEQDTYQKLHELFRKK